MKIDLAVAGTANVKALVGFTQNRDDGGRARVAWGDDQLGQRRCAVVFDLQNGAVAGAKIDARAVEARNRRHANRARA